ncbi:hypothetical protein GIB67_035886 [Kingdonia uniflora]|uniref:Uncharacterized protein n=1 Tax=Kingdonia uniflora TaxID=39325 RepID=A0A7J7P8L5_9MAGN|nr:hypothetical protein GIB67_035886 [Kingdonia uniflora]
MYHGLDTAVMTGDTITGFSQLLEYWFYEYCGVGHLVAKEEVKFSSYPHLRAWERGNRKKIHDKATNLFILGRYHISHRTIETITWRPWLDYTVSELDDVWTASLLSHKRMPLQVSNGNCEYYLGDRCWRQLTCTTGPTSEGGRDVRVVPLPPRGGTRARQGNRGRDLRTLGAGCWTSILDWSTSWYIILYNGIALQGNGQLTLKLQQVKRDYMSVCDRFLNLGLRKQDLITSMNWDVHYNCWSSRIFLTYNRPLLKEDKRGYPLIEYEKFEEVQAVISGMEGI